MVSLCLKKKIEVSWNSFRLGVGVNWLRLVNFVFYINHLKLFALISKVTLTEENLSTGLNYRLQVQLVGSDYNWLEGLEFWTC